MNSTKVNVLIVASSLWIGGAETVIRQLALYLDRRRFSVAVCHLKDRGHVGEQLAHEGIDIVGIPKPAYSGTDYLSFIKLLKVIRQKRIVLVHTHTTDGLIDCCLCKLFMPRLRIIHTFHFGNYPFARRRIMWMERIFSRLADKLIAVGDVQRNQIKDVYGFSDKQIATILNGVMAPPSSVDTSFRNKWCLEGFILVGTIATLISQKGLSGLLDVAKAISDSGRKVIFVIVGEGHLRRELEEKRHELGLDDTVKLTGWIPNAAHVALPSFDIFFQPSQWEAMSMVILEAMAAGKPIVATRVGENSKVIDHGVDGLLVNPGHITEMVDAIGLLLDDANLRLRLGRAARRKAEEYFTVGQMVRRYEDEYENLMA